MSEDFRIEHDSLGDVQVPAQALYGGQTQRGSRKLPHLGDATLAGIYLVYGQHQARCRRSQPRPGAVGC